MAQFDREAFRRLAEKNRALEYEEGDDEDSGDDKTPYSSLAREGAPEPVIMPDLDGESKNPEADAQAEQTPPPPPPSAPPPPPPDMASMGVPERAPTSTPVNPINKDPFMQKFEEEQKRIAGLREAQRGSNALASIGAASQQLAMGANRPQPNEALIHNSQKTGDDILRSEQHSADSRARVINAIEGRKYREQMAQLSNNNRKDAKELAQKYKEDKFTDDLVKNMQKDLDPNQARGGNMAKNQAQVDQAERLAGLYTEANGDIRNLDSRQMEELAIGMNKMLSGSSSGSVTQVQALLPHTAVGNAQKLKEWLMNDPTGVDQIAFVKRMAETVVREKEIAQNQVKAAQVKRLSAYEKLKRNDPDRYSQVLNAYGIDPDDIDEKGQYKPAAKESAPKPVRMIDPNGKVRLIPKDKVDDAIAAGGKLADTEEASSD